MLTVRRVGVDYRCDGPIEVLSMGDVRVSVPTPSTPRESGAFIPGVCNQLLQTAVSPICVKGSGHYW